MEAKHKEVLVTGATGFIGANLIRRLIEEGYEVHILTRKTSNKWRLSDVLDRVSNHTGDLINFVGLKKLVEEIRPEVIFHLATEGVYAGQQLKEREVITTNFVGTFNLIEACEGIDYKCFVNTGTSSEYGSKDKPMKENDVCNPVNTYGITKLASTLYGSHIARLKDKPIVTFRLFSPFGPYDNSFRLIPYVIMNALKGKDLQLANPNTVRDYIYIENVLQPYIDIIKKADKLKGEVFNIGSGKETKIPQVIEKVLELTGSESKVFWGKAVPRPFDTPHWEADMSKSKSMIDIDIKIGFEEGLRKTIEWFKKNMDLYELRNKEKMGK